MQETPKSLIDSMDYRTRQNHFQEELQEKLRTMGRLPLWQYDKVIKELTKKWKV